MPTDGTKRERQSFLAAGLLLLLPITNAYVVPFSLSRQSRHQGTVTTRQPTSLGSGDDDNWDFPEEVVANDDDMSSAVFATKESFVGEADLAQQANEIAATSTIELPSEVEKSFLQYSLSIILGRALPDARDGLKPVHRRILFAMSELGLASNQAHRKCARVVGEVLGKYHPHGDMAVYDALVRMAQDFSSGTPLIDGQGNFGSIDADPAAAMRYTECRLTPVAQEAMLEDLYQDTVDFVPNFDGNEQEPLVLPARLPILLLNGCAGIAVGMATNVPPHNLVELLNGCKAMVDSRRKQTELTDQELFRLIPGPDFPTGATIIGTDGAKDLYATGRGSVVVRANTHVETVVAGGKSKTRTAIVVTALPYQVNKALLLERTANLVNEKKLEGIADLRDESDRDGMRIVIELKRDAVADVVLNNLYKKTPLQTSFSGNFLALMGSGTVPQRFTLRSALDYFLDFRFETIRRRSAFELDKVESRAHIVDGLLAALSRVDDVIEWIRSAPDQAGARECLMDPELLGLSRDQADSVLRLQLGQLTRLNKGKLETEKQDLLASQKQLQELLTVDDAVLARMNDEFDGLQTKFGIERRTAIETEEEGSLSDLDLIKNARSVIVVTQGSYIKRMPLKTFESQKRGTRGKRGTSDASQGDNEVAHAFTCNDHDTLLMVTEKGIAFGLPAYQVPTGSRTAKGQPIPSVLPIGQGDHITAMLPVSEFSDDEYIVLVTEHGFIKRTALAAFSKISSRGLMITSLKDGDQLLSAQLCRDEDDLLIASKGGMAARFAALSVRPTSRQARGVKSIRLKEGDCITDMNVLSSAKDDIKEEYVLAVTSEGFGKLVATDSFPLRARGGVGVIAIKFKKGMRDDRIVCLKTVRSDDEVLLITAKGIMVRQKVSNISTQSRRATGVVLQKLDEGDHITTASIVPEYNEN